MNRSRRCRALSFESLDSRRVLAGVATAAVTSGELLISGDYHSEILAVSSGQNAGDIVISPGGQTTLNGQLAAQTFSGVTSIRLNMQTGNDKIVFTNINFTGSITAGMGFGDDEMIFRGTAPSSPDFAINQGSIPYGPVTVGSVTMKGNDGNDAFRVFNAKTSGLDSRQGTVTICFSSMERSARIRLLV